jgi:hypothetical protein
MTTVSRPANCTCTFPATRWHDPGEVSVCAPCEAAMEAAADEEERWNAGARIADDCICPGCGARGFRAPCPGCSSQ